MHHLRSSGVSFEILKVSTTMASGSWVVEELEKE